jgi:hypothetical protein
MLPPGATDPPGPFSEQFRIQNNKEFFPRELRIPQAHFPYSYLQMSPMYSWAPNLFACYLLSLKATRLILSTESGLERSGKLLRVAFNSAKRIYK